MIHTVEISDWAKVFSSTEQNEAIQALENGQVIYLPRLSFELLNAEKKFLTPTSLSQKSKNISYNPGTHEIKGMNELGSITEIKNMMTRFVDQSHHLLSQLLPLYQPYLLEGRTSFRPAEIKGRKTSPRKDDTRLHVDAFRATPNQGNRILRIFSNINPEGKSRVWLLGESFETVVQKFYTKFRKPLPGIRALLSYLKLTRSYRSLYDHYMLILHDAMKLDKNYQEKVEKLEFHFPPGATWIVMTDQVSHAALSGQHLLEQTFYLPVDAMRNKALSPLHMLQKYIGF